MVILIYTHDCGCVDECVNWVVMEKKHFFFQVIYLAVSSFSCDMWGQFPDQGSNLDALHWECRALVTGPRGKSL